MIRTFIQVTSLVLTLEAAFFLAKGNLGLSVKAIAELASSRWDYHPVLIDSLSQQHADTWAGVALLLVGFTLQMVNALWPMRWGDLAVHRGAAIFALVFSLVVGFGAFYATKEVAQNTAEDVRMILDQRMRGADPEPD